MILNVYIFFYQRHFPLHFTEFLFSCDINTNRKFMFGMTTLEALRQAIIRKHGVIYKLEQDPDSVFKVVNSPLVLKQIPFSQFLNLLPAGSHLRRRKQPYNKLYYQGNFVTFRFTIRLDIKITKTVNTDTWFVRVC